MDEPSKSLEEKRLLLGWSCSELARRAKVPKSATISISLGNIVSDEYIGPIIKALNEGLEAHTKSLSKGTNMEWTEIDGLKLRTKRQSLGISMHDLAHESRISIAAISRIEKADFEMSKLWADHIKHLERVLSATSKRRIVMESPIKDHEIVKNRFYRGRWEVVLNPPYRRKKRMPLSHYNWLLHNPAFEDIPKGYCIHHLDGNRMNDDISNLALMHERYHRAYHLKHYNIEVEAIIEGERPLISIENKLFVADMILEPRIHFDRTKTKRWLIKFREMDSITGEKKNRFMRRYDGKPFRTKEDAERVKQIIIKNHPKVYKDHFGGELLEDDETGE